MGATLTRRVHQRDPRELIPNSQWALADCTSTPFPGAPDPTKVCLQGGFDTNHIYELVYTAKNPTVAGLGFAATRDFISFLRNGNGNGSGSDPNGHKTGATLLPPSPPNPLGDAIQNALIFGSSQSGRWIRTFIHLGFNQDEGGAQVTEGAMPHIASNRGAFNIRFAQPTRLSGTQHTEVEFPGAESPGTWGTTNDKLSGVKGGQLERCSNTQSCPKIIQTVSDTEYWQSLMSLNTTDSSAAQDFKLPKDVRLFQFSSTQHGGGNPLAQPPAVLPNVPNNCQLRANSNPYVWHQRALLVALREWVVNGTPPPNSLYSALRTPELGEPQPDPHPVHPRGELHPARSREPEVRPRPRAAIRRRGCVGNHGRAASAGGRLSGVAAAGGRRRQRHRRASECQRAGATRDLHRVEHQKGRIQRRGFVRPHRCVHPVLPDPGGTSRCRRSAPIVGGAVRNARRLRQRHHEAATELAGQRLLLPEDAASIVAAASAAAVP